MKRAALLMLALGLAPAAAATKESRPVSILPGGDSKSPISIDADKLDYFEKEGRAVYDGHVVVVQGDTRLSCSKLTIFMDASHTEAKPANAASGAGPGRFSAMSTLVWGRACLSWSPSDRPAKPPPRIATS